MQIEIFTRSYEATVTTAEEGMTFTLTPNAQKELQAYLDMVLPYYVEMDADADSLEELLRIANEWQAANPEMKLAEPTTKLPYDVPIEDKQLLEKLAAAKGISQAKLLVEMIDERYNQLQEG